jgi:lysophospholipase L1-like esterase
VRGPLFTTDDVGQRGTHYSPPREETPNAVGFVLPLMRQEIETAVRTLREYGDANVHYVDGLRNLGPDHAELLPDDLHPNKAGYKLMGENISRIFGEIFAL